MNRFIPFILVCFTLGTNTQVVEGKEIVSICLKPVSDSLPKSNCSDTVAIAKIITDAIALGAPIYNAGLHMECYRVYEWAAYKILYVYGHNCKEMETILRIVIEKSHGDYSDIEKAWLMRVAFDKILGVPTKTGTSENNPSEKKYEQKQS